MNGLTIRYLVRFVRSEKQRHHRSFLGTRYMAPPAAMGIALEMFFFCLFFFSLPVPRCFAIDHAAFRMTRLAVERLSRANRPGGVLLPFFIFLVYIARNTRTHVSVFGSRDILRKAHSFGIWYHHVYG